MILKQTVHEKGAQRKKTTKLYLRGLIPTRVWWHDVYIELHNVVSHTDKGLMKRIPFCKSICNSLCKVLE